MSTFAIIFGKLINNYSRMLKRRLLNLRKLWLSLLLLVGATAIAIPGIQEVAGTEDDNVVEISTVEQLKAFRDAVNSGNQFTDKTVKLTADLDLSGETNWTPIGNLVAYPGQSFNGTFDGDGHTISNLTVNDNTPNHAVAALFGSVVNGTIKNLTVKNVNITSTHFAAGIVAYTSNGPTIENCHVIGGTIKSTPEIVNGSYDNGDKVGGIMGYATAGSTINNCTVEGVTLSAYRDMGGIVGYSAGTVTNNTAKNVTVTQDLTNGYKNPTPTTIGDIIGRDGGATLSNNKVIKSDYVAQIGETKFETLQTAFDAAQDGDVVELLKDYDASAENNGNYNNTKRNLWLAKGVTVNGNNHTLTVTYRGIGVKGESGNIDVVFKDINIKNVGNKDGRCIDTRGNLNSLTLNNVTLTTEESSYTGYLQPLTIGGDQSTTTTVNITNSNIITVDNAKKGYAITTFNPVEMNIDGSTLKGWACLNIKGEDSSFGSKGSTITVTNSTLVSANGTPGNTNAYSLIKIEDDNINVNITSSTVNINGEGNTQSIVSFLKTDLSSSSANCTVSMGDGNNVTFDGSYGYSSWEGETSKLVISGGIFNQPVPEQNCAEGFVPVKISDGKYSVAQGSYVAQIGEDKYVSLQSAVDAAYAMTGDVTIELIDNITGYSIVKQKAGLNLTIDGKEMTVNGQIIIDGDGGYNRSETLDIKNIKFEDDRTNFVAGSDAFIFVPSTNTAGTPYYNKPTNNYSHNVTISNCSFTNTADDLKTVAIKTSSGGGNCYHLVVNNVTGTKLHSLAQLTGSENTNVITNNTIDNSDSFVNVSGGSGTFNISNNTFTSSVTDGYGVRENSSSSAVITLSDNTFTAAKAVVLGKSKSATNGTINVVSGTYVGDIVKDIAATATGKIVISGGKFSAPVGNSDYAQFIEEGKTGVNGLYPDDENAPNGIGTAIAKLTDSEGKVSNYATLEAAFASATDGATITLLANCEGNGISVPANKFATGLTVDFNNFTYTITGPGLAGSTGTKTQAFQLLKDNKITFKNGAIVGNNADVKMMIQNYSDLTLDNMVLDATQGTNNIGYVLSTNNGNTVIKDTKITAKEGGKAFDADSGWGNYASNTVELTGESVINGDIEVAFEKKTEGTPSVLKLTSGTLNGNIVLGANADECTVTKSDAFEAAAPADHKWVDNGDGTSTLKPCEYVAQIEGGAKFESLEAAFAAATDGATITLLANSEGNGIIAPEGKFNTTGLTVNFNNFTYTISGPSLAGSTGTKTQAFQLLKDNKITFKNGAIVGNNADVKMMIQNYSDLTLDNMVLDATQGTNNIGYVLSTNFGNTTIKDTKIIAKENGTAFDACTGWGGYTSNNVELTGSSEITGPIEVSFSGDGTAPVLKLTSGTHTGEIVMADGADKATVTKNNDFVQAAPEGYKWVDNGNGTSTLKPCEYICAIGDVKYETLQDAVNAAGTAETTITLLTDAATDGVISGNGVKVPSGSNITFDLNGLTYDASGVTVGSTSTETQGFQLLKGSNITFKNGTLKATSPTAQMLIQNYSNLTLEDVNLDGTGLSGWAYALSNNCGTINLTGSTSITAKEGGRAFDTCKFGSYEIPTVNINTTGTISGTIEATGGKLNIENGKFNVAWVTDSHYAAGDIQITGGVFTEKPAEDYCAEGYVPTDNTDEATKAEYPYAVKTKEDAGIFELIDGKVYPYLDYTEDKQAASVTYKRIFKNKNWQALFIPFDINDVSELTDRYEFAKIHMVALENDGTFTTGDKIELYFTKITSGKISANQPYLIKAKTANENEYQEIVVENTILKDTHNMRPRKTSTMAADYVFSGTYEGITGQEDHDFMALGTKGNGASTLNFSKKGSKLGTYRWYINIEPYDDNYAKPTVVIIEEDADATGISSASIEQDAEIEGYYSINGVRSEVPAKGMNIVKYKNGKTKKIMVK